MSRLANLNQTIANAILVLGKPGSRRWQIFENVDGRRVAPEIARVLKIQSTNCVNELTFLAEKGLIEEAGRKGKAVIYRKIPELRNVNLRSHVQIGRKSYSLEQEKPTQQAGREMAEVGIKSRSIERVIEIGKSYGIENIDQNWIDSLVVLNFIETVLTKFLTDHGFTEDKIETMNWDDKIQKVENKLFEEAKVFSVRPRQLVLNNLKNYRTNRNLIDHEAHVSDARIKSHEVTLLLKLLQALVKEIFEEHKSYCTLVQSGSAS